MKTKTGVTFNQAKSAARSLNYRRRLNEALPELEGRLIHYINQQVGSGLSSNDNNKVTALIGPYKVKLAGDELSISEVDPIDPNQLKFEFYDQEVEDDQRST